MCSVFLDQDVPRTISAIALTAWMNRSGRNLLAGIARLVVRARFLAAPNPNVAINQPASLTKLQHRFIEAQRNHYTLGIHMTHTYTHTRDCCILLHFQKVRAKCSKLFCCISSGRTGRTQVGHLQKEHVRLQISLFFFVWEAVVAKSLLISKSR